MKDDPIESIKEEQLILRYLKKHVAERARILRLAKWEEDNFVSSKK